MCIDKYVQKGSFTFTIEKFKSEELDKVVEINRICLPENYPRYFFMDHYKKYPEAFLVAKQGKEIIGYIMNRIEYGVLHIGLGVGKKGHIISIAVLPEFRRRGVATALIQRAMKDVKGFYGAKEFFLEVRSSNIPAISLYKNLGFEEVKRVKGYYLDGEDAYLLVIRL